MAKWSLAASLVLVLVLTAGCTSSAEEPDDALTKSGQAEQAGVTYQEMQMDARAEDALAAMPVYIEESVARDEADGEIEGEDYLDVTGIEPIFVGYEVIAWEPIQGSEDVEYYEVSYMNDHIANGYATPDDELSYSPDPYPASVSNIREMPSNPSAGELEAVDAAKIALAEQVDGASELTYGVKRYLFLYEKDGMGVVMGMTADGELGSRSMPVELAE